MGDNQAKVMAEQWGKTHGYLDGYLRGYTWGLYKAANQNLDSKSKFDDGKKSATALGSYMESGLQAGIKKAESLAETKAEQEIQDRVKKAMNSNKPFDMSISQPKDIPFTPEQDPYTRLVGPVPTVKTLSAEAEKYSGGLNSRFSDELNLIGRGGAFGNISLYNSTTYANVDYWKTDNRPFYFWWSLWDFEGMFRAVGYADRDLAWRFFLSKPYWGKGGYEALANQKVFEKKQVKKSFPVLNPDGTQVYETGVSGAQVPKMEERWVVEESPISMQPFFEDGFKRSYGYYINWRYSYSFEEALDEGTYDGEAIGAIVGGAIAKYRGQQVGFNEVYNASAEKSFKAAYGNKYSETLYNKLQERATKSFLTLELKSLKGVNEDGVTQPGEVVDGEILVTNRGGQPANFSLMALGDVEDSSVLKENIGPFSTKTIVFKSMTKISKQVPNNQSAKVSVQLQGSGHQLTSSLNEKVQYMVQLLEWDSSFNMFKGTGVAELKIKNISNFAAVASPIELMIYVEGKKYSATVEKLNAQEVRPVILSYSGIDPMKYAGGELEVVVQATMSDLTLFKDKTHMGVPNTTDFYMDYQKALIMGEGYAPVSNVDDRIRALAEFVFKDNADEVKRHKAALSNSPWNDDNGINTLPGRLHSRKEAAGNSPKANQHYLWMGKKMCEEKSQFGFFAGSRKKKYMEVVSRLYSGDEKCK